MRKLNNKAVSTVFGSILFIVLAVGVVSALIVTFYHYDQLSSQALGTEKLRLEEKLILVKLEIELSEGTEYVTRVLVSNEGTITSKICAVYVDEKFLFDPSKDNTINPIPYINAKQTLWINIPLAKIPYQEESYLKMATELGSLTIEQQGKLKNPPNPPNPANIPVFGPLQLDFEYFYYTECDSKGNFDPNSWKEGSSIDIGVRSIVWKIAVTNICNKDITLSKFSCLTTMPNDMSLKQRPWYLEPSKTEGGSANGILIESKEKLSLVYIWESSAGTTPQTIYDVQLQAKILLTFFGTFHEKDGSTKPYGQTIPFQAINMRLPRLEIQATPTTVAAGSTTESTITVITRTLYGDPAPNQQVSISTDHGVLKSNTVTTNIQGIATTTFNALQETSPNTATITALWNSLRSIATVNIGLGALAISANPATIVLDSSSTITATLTYGGAPLPGQSVTFSANIGTLHSSSVTTNSLGKATITFSGSIPGDATVTASALAGTATDSTHVHTITGISVSPSSPTLTAGETQRYKAITIPGDWDVTSSVVWSVTPEAGGSWDQSTATYTTNKAGMWTVTATFGTISGSSSLTVNPAAASSLVVSGFPSSVTAGVTHDIWVTAKDSFGNTASDYLGTVEISSSDRSAVLPASTGLTDGIGTFRVTLETVGKHSITATDTMDGLITGTQSSITVGSAGASFLAVSGFPNPVTAGLVGTVTVEALDAYGNRATEYSGTVAVTSTDNSAVLPASSGLTAGLGTFTVTLKTVGLQSISATDSVASTITGTQTALTVDPAAAFSFAVTGFPSPTTAGIAGTVSVEALDAYGNRATGYSGTVIITSTDGSATMPAPGSLIAGIGTFAVTLKTAGLSSITATDLATSTISGTQSSIKVATGSLNYITINPASASIVTGGSETYSVEAFDAYHNSLGDVTPFATFTLDGAVVASNVMSSSVVGDHIVEASYGGKIALAALTVTSGGS